MTTIIGIFIAENSIQNFYDPIHTEGLFFFFFKAVSKKLTTHFINVSGS